MLCRCGDSSLGDDVSDVMMDGKTQWDSIRNGQPSNRTEFIYDLNSITGQAAIR